MKKLLTIFISFSFVACGTNAPQPPKVREKRIYAPGNAPAELYDVSTKTYQPIEAGHKIVCLSLEDEKALKIYEASTLRKWINKNCR